MGDASVRLPSLEGASAVHLIISPTIEADYRNRGAFPGLRSDSAQRRSGKNLIFRVPIPFAREVLEDARERRFHADCGRGLTVAYSALVKGLQTLLDMADGVLADPGLAAVEAEAAAKSLGCHPVGTLLRNQYDEVVTVSRSYSAIQFLDESDGEFRSKEGDKKRFSYRWGYLCKTLGSEETYFYPAGDLYAVDGSITHLRLVHSA